MKRVINSIPELTLQIYAYELSDESMIQIARDVVLIAMSLGKGEDFEGIRDNVILNWRHEVASRYSHPRVYRHFFN